MMLALTVASAAILGGALITYLYEDDAPLAWRLCAGACTGFAAIGMIVFGLASWLRLTLLTSVVAAAAAIVSLSVFSAQQHRAQLLADLQGALGAARAYVQRARTRTMVHVMLYSVVALLLWGLLDRVVFERSDGIYTGVMNNYGDLPFHIGAITTFAVGENFPPEHPAYAGVRFTYPFLADLIAAAFMATGMSLRGAMLLENLVLAISLIGVLHWWSWDLTRDRVVARLSPLIVLLSGGLGWWLLVRELQKTEMGIVTTLTHLTHDYTIMPGSDWRWGNLVTALLIPQRGMLFGLPLAILVFTLWWRSVDSERARVDAGSSVTEPLGAASGGSKHPMAARRRRMAAAGLLAGLLPLVHAHSYAVVTTIGGCLALTLGPLRLWVPFFVASLGLGLPQVLWLAGGSSVETERFVGWQFGWDRGNQNVFWFWLKNTGVLIPLILVAILWRGRRPPVPRTLLRFYLPYTLCLLVPNVLRLSPWIWDNIKLLIYWHVASAPLVALVLVRLWRGPRLHRVVSLALTASLTLAGALDIWRVISRASEARVFTREGMALAELVRRTVPPGSVILHAPTYNHPIFLTGRRSLMGYAGHLWSHGLPYASREADINRMYAGAPEAEGLMRRYGVAYVVLGPVERDTMPVNDSFLERYPKVGEIGSYVLFRTASPPE